MFEQSLTTRYAALLQQFDTLKANIVCFTRLILIRQALLPPPGSFAHRLFKMQFAKNLKTSRMKRIVGIQLFATRCRRTRQTLTVTDIPAGSDVLLNSSGVHKVGHTAMMFLNK